MNLERKITNAAAAAAVGGDNNGTRAAALAGKLACGIRGTSSHKTKVCYIFIQQLLTLEVQEKLTTYQKAKDVCLFFDIFIRKK